MIEREYQDLKEAAEINPEIWDVHRQVGILYGLVCLRRGEEQKAAAAAMSVAVRRRAQMIEATWEGVEVVE